MCSNPTKTAGDLAEAIEPTFITLMDDTGLASTPDGASAIKAWDIVEAELENYKPGDGAEIAEQAIQTFNSIFQALPVPAASKPFAAIISAGVVTLIGVIAGNQPPPAPPEGTDVTATPEETVQAHQQEVIDNTTARVKELVPNFTRSKWHSPAHQYQKTWENQAIKTGPASLKLENLHSRKAEPKK